eukprot:TRINITY_DN8302_c1_g1_i1.p1 TRINITY_DN8302_c1_g1~~TRINITY_DN8302_c1_g1_i1.p1  ORF type:complete len:363 (-),score=51.10 TRINITY_DN8302_c1_g1_i1:147-1235(-)
MERLRLKPRRRSVRRVLVTALAGLTATVSCLVPLVRCFAFPGNSRSDRGVKAVHAQSRPLRLRPVQSLDITASKEHNIPSAHEGISRFCGFSSRFLRHIGFVAGTFNLVFGVLTLAATRASKQRRKRDVAPVVDPDRPALVKQQTGIKKIDDDRKNSELARKWAESLGVTDEDRDRRREYKRKKRKWDNMEVQWDDGQIVRRVNEGLDPNFFGFPFIWVQIAHSLMGGLAVAVYLFSDVDEIEFVLFDLEGPALDSLKIALPLVLLINVVNALVIVKEELDYKPEPGEESGKETRDESEEALGEERTRAAIGWGLKALVLGGAASWQRSSRLYREVEQKRDKEIDKLLDLEEQNRDALANPW